MILDHTTLLILAMDTVGVGGRGALAVEMRLSCTNRQNFISVCRTCLCAGVGGAETFCWRAGVAFFLH